MDKGQHVGMLVLDLQKAFDTVNHFVFLMKWETIGISESGLRCFFPTYVPDTS